MTFTKGLVMMTMAMIGAGTTAYQNDVIYEKQDTPPVNYNYRYQKRGWEDNIVIYMENVQERKT